MTFDSLRTIPTQRRPFNNAFDLELASMEEGSHRPSSSSSGPSSPPTRTSSPRRVNLNPRELQHVLSGTNYDDDIPELSELFTLSTYLLPLLQKAHRHALSTIFREFLAESYFTSNPGGPIVTLAKNQIKFSQNQGAGKPSIDLKALSEGRMWTVPGISDVELKKALRKAWVKHLGLAESSGSLKRTIAEDMKNLISKAIQGREPFETLEPGLAPMHSFIQTFNLPSMPFGLPSPRLLINNLPMATPATPSDPDSAASYPGHPAPVKPSAPLSFTPPTLSESEIKQWVSVPPSFHNHAAVVYGVLSANVTVDNVVTGSNLSIRSPMAQPAVFEYLAKAVSWVAGKGEVFAKELFKEVLDESWSKSEAWGEAQGWEWVRDLTGPGVVAGGLQSAEDANGWRHALNGMGSGAGPFGRDDKLAERTELWLKCWDTVNKSRVEAMIAEQQGDEHALKGNNMAAISAFTAALDFDPFARPQLLLKRATAYRASELYADAEKDLIEVTTLPETSTLPTVAPARAMLKKVRVKIKNADKPGPSAATIKKQKKKAKAKAKGAGESAPISGADVAAIMDDSPDKDEDAASSAGLGLGVEIQQNAVESDAAKAVAEQTATPMDVDEPAPADPVADETSATSPLRTSSTTPKPRNPPPSLPSPPSTTLPLSSPRPQESPSSTVIASVSSPSPPSAAISPEDATISSSSSSTSDAIISSTSTSTETAATSAFDSPLTPRSEARDVSLDRAAVDVKASSTLAKPAARQQLERRTSLVEMDTVKLEIELDDDESEQGEHEVVFGRVERTVVPDETTPKQEMASPEQEETETVAASSQEQDAVPTLVVPGYSWDGSYAPAREPQELEFEAGIWLMVCGQFFETQSCDDDDCFFMHELPDHSVEPSPPSPPVPATAPTVQPLVANAAPSDPAPAPSSPETEPGTINSLLLPSSSSLQRLTLEELQEEFPSPNPQDDATSTFASPVPDAESSPATQFLPTLVFSSHEDHEAGEGVSELGDDGGVSKVTTAKKWFELDGDWGNEQDWEHERNSAQTQQTEDAVEDTPEPEAVVEPPAVEKQPKKKKVASPTGMPTTSIPMEKRVVPGAAPKDAPSAVAPPARVPAVVPAPAPAASDRWWEKGANAVREEKQEEWVVANGKAKKGSKGGPKTAW